MRKRHAAYRLFFRKILSRSLAFTQTQLYLTPRYPISFQRKSVKGSMTLGFSYKLSKCYNLVKESHEHDLFLAILNITVGLPEQDLPGQRPSQSTFERTAFMIIESNH